MISTSCEWETPLAQAIELYKAGDHEESRQLLETLAAKHPGVAAIQGLLGRAYFMRAEYDIALRYFKAAAELNPDSELASLGLYQCFAETDRADEALEEMRRFTASHVSEDYRAIAEDAGFSLAELHAEAEST